MTNLDISSTAEGLLTLRYQNIVHHGHMTFRGRARPGIGHPARTRRIFNQLKTC